MTEQKSTASYFPRSIQISAKSWRSLELAALSRLITERGIPQIIFYRQLSLKLNRREPSSQFKPVHAGHLNLYATLQKIYRYIIDEIAEFQAPGVLTEAARRGGFDPAGSEAGLVMERFVHLFPPKDVLAGTSDSAAWLERGDKRVEHRRIVLRELLMLRIAAENPAIDSFRVILDDRPLAKSSPYLKLVAGMDAALSKEPLLEGLDLTLLLSLIHI